MTPSISAALCNADRKVALEHYSSCPSIYRGFQELFVQMPLQPVQEEDLSMVGLAG